MKILVTGSSGHLGEALIVTLKRKGIPCVGTDLLAGPMTTHVGSITDRTFVDTLMQGVDYVIHTATLHKPHVVTHSKQNFIDVNILGTLHLLEAAVAGGVKGFVFTSTTSTYGDALRPAPHEPAVWVNEPLRPRPKNIYGTSKIAAEDLCQLFHRNHQLPCIVLKTSRFFWEHDDRKELREAYEDLNIKANEYLNRRVDVQDVVDAHLLAVEKVVAMGFEKFIISATTPFMQSQLRDLNTDAPAMVQSIYPDFETIYARQGWQMFPVIGRVYVNQKARTQLGWQPQYDFAYVLTCLREGKSFKSPLAREVGIKGYHDEQFEEGPYPVTGQDG
ncbi:MAG: NAD(P)-dependent oxidoreductase [Bacteroidota bacterium]